MSREPKVEIVQEPGKIDSLAATGNVIETVDTSWRFSRYLHERRPD
jgi:hypothetical protein